MFKDIRAGMHLARNPRSAKTTRHIDFVHRYVQDLGDNEAKELLDVASFDLHADVLTTSLGRALFDERRNVLLDYDDVYAGKSKKSNVIRRRRKGHCSIIYPDDHYVGPPDER